MLYIEKEKTEIAREAAELLRPMLSDLVYTMLKPAIESIIKTAEQEAVKRIAAKLLEQAVIETLAGKTGA